MTREELLKGILGKQIVEVQGEFMYEQYINNPVFVLEDGTTFHLVSGDPYCETELHQTGIGKE